MTTASLMLSVGVMGLIGAVEGHAYQWRYRATHGTPMQAAMSTAWVTTLRCLWMGLGVAALLRGGLVEGLIVGAAYVVAAAISTGWTRAGEAAAKERNRD